MKIYRMIRCEVKSVWMKAVWLSLFHLFTFSPLAAQETARKFSPEKFQAEMEQFITKEAGLTADESAKFFPLYREMQQKQRAIFGKVRKEGFVKPVDDAACRKLVERRDATELEMKKIQKTYHEKFFDVLPASKVLQVIQAEERFHRRTFRNWGQGNGHPQRQGHQK
jgi:hypothetical protein